MQMHGLTHHAKRLLARRAAPLAVAMLAAAQLAWTRVGLFDAVVFLAFLTWLLLAAVILAKTAGRLAKSLLWART